jgi:Mg-chelatase subunit ChlD
MTKSLRKSLFTFTILTASAGTVAVAAGLNPFASKTSPAPLSAIPDLVRQPVVTNTVPFDGSAIDIVFAVDTTGSMTKLIEAAKSTVWSIAKHTQKLAPNAKIRIGLVAYRDVGEAYVTKTFNLSTDLDAAYAELSAYSAAGGGDTPEDVAKALDEAVNRMAWTDNAAKMIFVVGDAPAGDRGDAPSLEALAKQATAKGITINTIRCGVDPNAAAQFEQLAMLGGGDYSSIAQSGGVQVIATPYDDSLAKIADEIDHTNVYYGSADGRGRAEATVAANAAAPAPAKADRAAYHAAAGGTGGYGDGDVVAQVAQGKMTVGGLEDAKLPAEIAGKSASEKAAWMMKKAETRKALEGQLLQLQKQREDFLRSNTKDAGEGFDAKVKGTVAKSLKK